MTAIVWDQIGRRTYDTGSDRAVLYPKSAPGVPWNGLVSVQEDVAGGEPSSYYYDSVKYLDVIASEDFQGVIEAYTYPDEFEKCMGSVYLAPGLLATRQPRSTFDLTYRTKIGNDIDGLRHGFKIHLIYNATAQPITKAYATVADTVTPSNFQWTITAVPPLGIGYKPTAHFVIDSTKTAPELIATLEQMLYGDFDNDPFIPSQVEVIELLKSSVDTVDGGDADWSSDDILDGGFLDWAIDDDSIDGETPSSPGLGTLDGGSPSSPGSGIITGSTMTVDWDSFGDTLDGGTY